MIIIIIIIIINSITYHNLPGIIVAVFTTSTHLKQVELATAQVAVAVQVTAIEYLSQCLPEKKRRYEIKRFEICLLYVHIILPLLHSHQLGRKSWGFLMHRPSIQQVVHKQRQRWHAEMTNMFSHSFFWCFFSCLLDSFDTLFLWNHLDHLSEHVHTRLNACKSHLKWIKQPSRLSILGLPCY